MSATLVDYLPSNDARVFGILTLATRKDFLKAIGLALSLRVSNPGVPLAVACSKDMRVLLEPYFDFVVDEKEGLKGFVHKVYLDQYSPFRETVFFDSDVLVFKPVRKLVEAWGSGPYYACGHYLSDGKGSFGLDRAAVLSKIGKQRLVEIGGAGHAFFRSPASYQVFELARSITGNYRSYAGDIEYADEDVMNIVMTLLDLPPAPYGEFFARYLSARTGTMEMDASNAVCSFVNAVDGKPFSPCMVHFAANEAPVAYMGQLFRLFRKFNVPTGGLVKLMFSDVLETQIRWRASRHLRRLSKWLGRGLGKGVA